MQKNATVEEINVVIARFEGRKFYGKYTIDDYGPHHGLTYPEMKYHTSWDWLMPVGKKIYELLAEMAKMRPRHTACHGDMIEVDITCHTREYNIIGAHKSIYEFLTWYNQQKQNDDSSSKP